MDRDTPGACSIMPKSFSAFTFSVKCMRRRLGLRGLGREKNHFLFVSHATIQFTFLIVLSQVVKNLSDTQRPYNLQPRSLDFSAREENSRTHVVHQRDASKPPERAAQLACPHARPQAHRHTGSHAQTEAAASRLRPGAPQEFIVSPKLHMKT